MPNKAIVDTTVLTDALLKNTAQGEAARLALRQYQETQLPVYAIKEFKAGPLRNYVWLHSKVVTGTYANAINSISQIWPQRNKARTAIGALHEFESSISHRLPADIGRRYPGITQGEVRRQEFELWLRTKIFRAWRKRRKITTRVIAPLSCYRETELRYRTSGTIDDTPVVCITDDCCLRAVFVASPNEVEQLLEACDRLPEKPETYKRRQALRHLHRTPNRRLDRRQCIALGDAVFAFQCPKDAVILTTNVADHGPLAAAVGVSAVEP